MKASILLLSLLLPVALLPMDDSKPDRDGIEIQPDLFDVTKDEHKSSLALLNSNFTVTKEMFWDLKINTGMFTSNSTAESLGTARVLIGQITANTDLILQFLFKYRVPLSQKNQLYTYLLDYNTMTRSLFEHVGSK